MIAQAQINPAQNFTYPVALRSLMRQDPQVIMVGEIRDPETASIAVQAGLTGHLVISTIHSGIAAGVYARLINMDIEPFLLASSIIAVLGIRLVRKNCTYCAESYQPEPGLMRLIPEDMVGKMEFRRGTGCQECLQTGFAGRNAFVMLSSRKCPRAPCRKSRSSKACAPSGKTVSPASPPAIPLWKRSSASWPLTKCEREI